MEKKQEYTMKEVVNATGLTEHTIRNWISEFNIQVSETDGGHRRFPLAAIETLKIAKRKKEEQGWSIKQIRQFLNGDLTTEMFQEEEIKTNIEKRIEQQDEKINMLIELNKNLIQKLDEQSKRLDQQRDEIINAINQKLENEIEHRDRQLMLEIRKSQDEAAAAAAVALNENTKNKSSFLSRIFTRNKEIKKGG